MKSRFPKVLFMFWAAVFVLALVCAFDFIYSSIAGPNGSAPALHINSGNSCGVAPANGLESHLRASGNRITWR